MKDTKLQPCPFCGSKPEIKRVQFTVAAFSYYYVACLNQDCKVSVATTWQLRDKKNAIAAWNRRVK